jgi:hypothetical protein
MGTRGVTLVAKPVISHEWVKDKTVLSFTHSWLITGFIFYSFMTYYRFYLLLIHDLLPVLSFTHSWLITGHPWCYSCCKTGNKSWMSKR